MAKVRPMVIRKNTAITMIRGVFRRNTATEPTEYFSVWMQGTNATLSRAPTPFPTNTETVQQWTSVNDIDVALDGEWVPQAPTGYTFLTYGDPLVAYVDHTGSLYAEFIGQPRVQLPGSFEKVSMVRGYKHQDDPNIDQGILVFAKRKNQTNIAVFAYLRSGGGLSWNAQEDILMTFEAKNLQAHTLSDYRIVLTVTGTEKTELVISDRTYVGQAIPPEFILLKAIDRLSGEDKLYPIETLKVAYVEKDKVTLEMVSKDAVTKVTEIRPAGRYWATNEGGTTIILFWDRDLKLADGATIEQMIAGFNITYSSAGATIPLPITAAVLNPYSVVFTCNDFNSVEGDINIHYTGDTLEYAPGWKQASFETSFTPTGLVPPEVDPPAIVKMIAVEVI